jgi:2-iminoacetate synthase
MLKILSYGKRWKLPPVRLNVKGMITGLSFAPLYLSNACVNNCAYCGLRTDNHDVNHGILTLDQVKRETEILAGTIGHKRLIVVYGEHPLSDSQYIADTLKAIYRVKVKTRKGEGGIRRVNIIAAPMSVEDLRMLNEVGIGTYQVFQETYHHKTYRNVHPENTLKGNYRWRITCMHRALEAGIDDVGIGLLFGLYDWRFEIMGLLYHTIELESKFGLGPLPSLSHDRTAENTIY